MTTGELPKVSVVSVFYNRAHLVDQSVQSLIDQTYPNLEILLVDDGSKDDTAAALERYADDPRVIVWRKENSGFTDTIDQAVRRTTGKYVAIHGSGDLSLPERMSRQAAMLEEDPGLGLVGSWRMTGETPEGPADIYKPPVERPMRQRILKRNFFVHGEVMFRRDLYDRVGGYRRAFVFAQDRDLWVRMSRHAEYGIVPEVLYHQMIVDGSVTKTVEKSLLQAYLSNFAIQCGEYYEKHGVDLLDRFGPAGFLLRRRSRDLADVLVRRGMHWMRFDDPAKGWVFVKAGWEEAKTPVSVAYTALASLYLVPGLWERAVLPLINIRRRKKVDPPATSRGTPA